MPSHLIFLQGITCQLTAHLHALEWVLPARKTHLHAIAEVQHIKILPSGSSHIQHQQQMHACNKRFPKPRFLFQHQKASIVCFPFSRPCPFNTPSSIPAFCGWPIWSRLPVSIHKVIIDTAPSHGCPPMNTLSCSDALPVSWGHKKPTCLA